MSKISKIWGRSLAWLKRPPVTRETVGSNPIAPAKFFMWPFKKKKIENLSDVLKKISQIEQKIEDLKERLEKLEQKEQFSIKKIGIFKFDALENLGGKQSFALAMLDENNNGVVISNLVLRENSRVFAKLIKNGFSESLLTEEERKAIEIAKNGKEQIFNHNKKTASSYYFRTH